MRTSARECAFKLVFSRAFHPVDESLKKSVFKSANLSEQDRAYAELLVNTVESNQTELFAMIDRYAIGFSHTRMFPVDRSVLLVALAEIQYIDEVPDVVAVDEAAGLVKRYSTEKSTGFMNGILSSVLKQKKKGIEV